MGLIEALRIWVTWEADGAGGLMTRVAAGECVIRGCLCGFERVICKGVALIAGRICEAEGGEGCDGAVLKVVTDLGGESEEWVAAGGLVH